MKFSMNVTATTEATLVQLAGELDLAARDEFTTGVQRLVDAGQRSVRVDLAGLTYCDSSGIAALLRGKAACSKAAGFMAVVGASGQVAWALDVAGVRAFLEGGPDVPE